MSTASPGDEDSLNLKLLGAIPASASRILELGCGDGALGRRFKQMRPGVQWWGVDASADALREFALIEGDRVTITGDGSVVLLAHVQPTLFTDRLVAKFKLPVEGWRGE